MRQKVGGPPRSHLHAALHHPCDAAQPDLPLQHSSPFSKTMPLFSHMKCLWASWRAAVSLTRSCLPRSPRPLPQRLNFRLNRVQTTVLNTHSLSDMIDAWAPPLPQAVVVVSDDMSKGVYGDVGSATAAAAAAVDIATMRRMYECILGGDVAAGAAAPAFMSGYSVYVDPAGPREEIERVKDEVSSRGAHVAAKTDVYVRPGSACPPVSPPANSTQSCAGVLPAIA